MKSKNIKVPLELLELIQNRTNGRPPGEVLLEIVKDYLHLEIISKSLATKMDLKNWEETVKTQKASGIINDYLNKRDQEIEEFQNDITELKTMLKGLEIYFTKVKK